MYVVRGKETGQKLAQPNSFVYTNKLKFYFPGKSK